MLPVMNVARYIVNYSNRKNYDISNLRLQKLLYFVQAYYLAFTDKHEACFKEHIEAWDFGPVVPDVYQAFKQYGSNSIPPVKKVFSIKRSNGLSFGARAFDESVIPEEDKQIIEEVVDTFSSYSTAGLVEITHHQDPWQIAYEPRRNNVISISSIREYFKE